MNFDYNLIFKYILQNKKQIFLQNKNVNQKNASIFLSIDQLYYLSLHLKLSSFFFSNQLIEIFSYEIATPWNNIKKNDLKKNNESIVVYNFNFFKNNGRVFLFVLNQSNFFLFKNTKNKNYLLSITELFSNANWLEREASELSGIFFFGKKDIRNLMLQYGDTSAPFKKSYPSVGLREIFYDSTTDLLVQNQTSIQF